MYICPDCKNKDQTKFEYYIDTYDQVPECVLNIMKCEILDPKYFHLVKLRCLRCYYYNWIEKFKNNIFHDALHYI